jgi:hypothetical protein
LKASVLSPFDQKRRAVYVRNKSPGQAVDTCLFGSFAGTKESSEQTKTSAPTLFERRHEESIP